MQVLGSIQILKDFLNGRNIIRIFKIILTKEAGSDSLLDLNQQHLKDYFDTRSCQLRFTDKSLRILEDHVLSYPPRILSYVARVLTNNNMKLRAIWS